MIGAFEADMPSVGIFWVVGAEPACTRLLAAGCSLKSGEPYGDFLTFPDGHYDVWQGWRTLRDTDAALRTLVRIFEYEEWPRGRMVFDRVKARFVLYTDRKLMLPATIAKIQSRFALPSDKTIVETDFDYQSPETPGPLPLIATSGVLSFGLLWLVFSLRSSGIRSSLPGRRDTPREEPRVRCEISKATVRWPVLHATT